ncbi:MAG: DUF349 domain-containing protein [Pseudomonadota bacterium]
MFEFLFKRPGDKPDAAPAAPSVQLNQPNEATVQRAQQAELAKTLAGDEAAAADFIVQSAFSELRLAAAEFIHSPVHLERVHAAMRNTDRRVAKLMQSRLDAIRHHGAELAKGEACLAQADTMLADAQLTPNQVAALDRAWSVIAAPELGARFAAARTALAQRLEAQVDLQRGVIDSLASLRELGGDSAPDAIAQRLDALAEAHAAALAAPEHATLPRTLLKEFAAEHARLTQSLAARPKQQAATPEAGAEAAPGSAPASSPASQDRSEPAEGTATADAADAPANDVATTASTSAAGAAPAAKARREKRAPAPALPPDQHFLDTLEAMEAAVENGALANAGELDKALKEVKGVRLPPAVSERLVHARAELKRLSDWARWGGNVSREELVKAVEQLPTLQLGVAELAKKVGSMRERWKGLDTLSGPAPKSLWERFDAACTSAYAPAAAHFKQLAEERHGNAAKGQALVVEAAALAAGLAAADAGDPDWKQLAATVQRLRQAWSHLGTIDRKEKKRIEHEFDAALKVLQAPLAQQRSGAVALREELIAQAGALNEQAGAPNAQGRNTLDTLRALQERWQEHARALPLERKTEQALWLRFRAACDAVFAKRKESAHAADAERRAHELAKEAICERLETAAPTLDAAGAGKLLREAATEWSAVGPVPRAHEARIDKRYQGAIAAVQQHLDAAKRNASMAQAGALREKLRLCQSLEAAVAGQGAVGETGADWAARWAALPPLAKEYERALQQRFDAALAARENGREAYAAGLAANRERLMREVLRLEIALGVDSGSEFARERLKLQVEVLQSSLKSGSKPLTESAQFVQLCAMPALLDDRTATRIEQLFSRIGKDRG